jgi:hypothetical protein
VVRAGGGRGRTFVFESRWKVELASLDDSTGLVTSLVTAPTTLDATEPWPTSLPHNDADTEFVNSTAYSGPLMS